MAGLFNRHLQTSKQYYGEKIGTIPKENPQIPLRSRAGSRTTFFHTDDIEVVENWLRDPCIIDGTSIVQTETKIREVGVYIPGPWIPFHPTLRSEREYYPEIKTPDTWPFEPNNDVEREKKVYANTFDDDEDDGDGDFELVKTVQEIVCHYKTYTSQVTTVVGDQQRESSKVVLQETEDPPKKVPKIIFD